MYHDLKLLFYIPKVQKRDTLPSDIGYCLRVTCHTFLWSSVAIVVHESTNNVSQNAKYIPLNLALLRFAACDFLIFQDFACRDALVSCQVDLKEEEYLVSAIHWKRRAANRLEKVCTYIGSYMLLARSWELDIPTCKSIPINNIANSHAKSAKDIRSSSEVICFYVSYYFLGWKK